MVGRDEQALAGVAAGIEADGGRALAVRADCTVPADLERLARTVAGELGSVDVVAAFAGGNGMPLPTVDETLEHWREVVDSELDARRS